VGFLRIGFSPFLVIFFFPIFSRVKWPCCPYLFCMDLTGSFSVRSFLWSCQIKVSLQLLGVFQAQTSLTAPTDGSSSHHTTHRNHTKWCGHNTRNTFTSTHNQIFGPITQARTRQLNNQVSSFVASYSSYLDNEKMYSVLLLRNDGQEQKRVAFTPVTFRF
jgi:hypothetical protein